MSTLTITAVTNLDHVACSVEIAGVSWTFAAYTTEVKTGRTFTTREVVALQPSIGTSKHEGYSRARATAIVRLREAAATRRLAASV